MYTGWRASGRRRGQLYELLARIKALRDQYRDAEILVIDRLSATGVVRISAGRITRVRRDHVVLDDGTLLPLHRIIAVEAGGRVLWRRSGGGDAGEEPEEDSEDEGERSRR